MSCEVPQEKPDRHRPHSPLPPGGWLRCHDFVCVARDAADEHTLDEYEFVDNDLDDDLDDDNLAASSGQRRLGVPGRVEDPDLLCARCGQDRGPHL